MTLKSMTGFGRGESEVGGRIWTVEVRCVNNRFLDIKIKLPRGYTQLEDGIRKLIMQSHQRGRVDVVLNVGGDFSDLQKISFNSGLAETYKSALHDLSQALDMEDNTTLSQLSAYPDVLVREQQSEDMERVLPVVEKALASALVQCDQMRIEEGKSILSDLQGRIEVFTETVQQIENIVPTLVERREKSLNERLNKLLGGLDVDPVRMHQEIAVMADKTDVTEELVRLRSHLNQFDSFLHEKGSVGRKLDFLIQEFLREVNTLASKINDAETAHLTVELKSELEKIREQVQNIE